jgi:TolB-like protein
MNWHARLSLCLIFAALPGQAMAGSSVSVAVMEFASKGGVTQKQMDALGDMLANEIRSMGDYHVIGKSDISTALDIEQRKTMMGCNENSCIAEVGGALGVRWVTVGNVSKFGDAYLLNIKILDATNVRVIAGVSKKVEGGESQLIDALSAAAKELFAKAGPIMAEDQQKIDKPAPGPDKTTAAATGTGAVIQSDKATPAALPPEVTTSAAPSWLNTWGHVAFWSGTGLTVLGTIALVVGMQKGDVYANSSLSDRERLDALDKSRAWSSAMWVGYGAGLAFMATGAAFWIWEAVCDSPGPTTAIALTPDGRGLVLGLGGRW